MGITPDWSDLSDRVEGDQDGSTDLWSDDFSGSTSLSTDSDAPTKPGFMGKTGVIGKRLSFSGLRALSAEANKHKWRNRIVLAAALVVATGIAVGTFLGINSSNTETPEGERSTGTGLQLPRLSELFSQLFPPRRESVGPIVTPTVISSPSPSATATATPSATPDFAGTAQAQVNENATASAQAVTATPSATATEAAPQLPAGVSANDHLLEARNIEHTVIPLDELDEEEPLSLDTIISEINDDIVDFLNIRMNEPVERYGVRFQNPIRFETDLNINGGYLEIQRINLETGEIDFVRTAPDQNAERAKFECRTVGFLINVRTVCDIYPGDLVHSTEENVEGYLYLAHLHDSSDVDLGNEVFLLVALEDILPSPSPAPRNTDEPTPGPSRPGEEHPAPTQIPIPPIPPTQIPVPPVPPTQIPVPVPLIVNGGYKFRGERIVRLSVEHLEENVKNSIPAESIINGEIHVPLSRLTQIR